MAFLASFLRELFCRVRLYFLGVRFCERDLSDEQQIHETTYRIHGEYEILFRCYRKTLTDMLFVRGDIIPLTYHSYFVEAVFSEQAPAVFHALKKPTIYFNGGTNRFGPNEEQTISLLMEIYLDFLKHILKTAESKGDGVDV